MFEYGDCEFDQPVYTGMSCGWLTVPESRADPNSERAIQLHVALYEARDEESQQDPVVVLLGGPDGPSLDLTYYLYAGLILPLSEQHPVVVFDQRGTGHSHPALTCPDGVAAERETVDERLSATEFVDRAIEAYSPCRDRLVAEGIDLSAYNTSQSTADVADLMAALGYDTYNLLGIDYGTRLAFAVMRDHPEHVRSVVMDSVWPLHVDPVAEEPHRAAELIEALMETCAASSSCAADYPDLEEEFWALVDRLDVAPKKVSAYPPGGGRRHDVLLDGDRLINAVARLTLNTHAIPTLPQAIAAAHAGDDRGLKIFAQGVLDRFEEAYATGAFFSMACHDEVPFLDQGHLAAAVADAGRVGEAFGAIDAWPSFCAMWDAGVAAADANTAVVSDIPVLLLTGSLDPITTVWTHDAYASLADATMVQFPSQSVWVLTNSRCAVDLAVAFLADPRSDLADECARAERALPFRPPFKS